MRGFTLLELLVTTVIIASFIGLAVPSTYNVLENIKNRQNFAKVQTFLFRARSLAQSKESHVTICPIIGSECSSSWDLPLSMFLDSNLNNHLDDDETLFYTLDATSTSGYWIKNNVRQPSIRFNPLGHAFSSAATLLYCTSSDNNNLSKAIIISFQGRLRTLNYLNKSGKRHTQFNHLNCL